MKFNINFLNNQKKQDFLIKKIDEVNAKKYWISLVVLCFAIFVFGAVFGFLTFRKSNLELIVDLNNLPKNSFYDKKEEINELLNYFKNKELKQINNIENLGVIDPSL